MNSKKFFLLSVIGGAAITFATKAIVNYRSRSRNKPAQTAGSHFEEIDRYITEQMSRLTIPGVAMAIVEGDQIVHMRCFGRAYSNGEPPTPQTPFFIGSTTKSMTAMAVMQLVEAGKIELDAPIQLYLPWFKVADPKATAQITVRHLLNQTSGLPAILGMSVLTNFDSRRDAAERQVCGLSSLVLSRPAGAKFEYSNLNYNLLGLIIEAMSGESYSDYIQHHIFEPLEMTHSFTSKAAANRNGLATGYRRWFGIPVPARNLPIPKGSIASGQLISCIEDMSRYLIAYLNDGQYKEKAILSAGGIQSLIHPAVAVYELSKYRGHYGKGWFIQGTGQTKIVSHGGTVPDFGAFIGLIPGQNKGMVLLYNTNNAIVKLTLDEMALGAAQRLAGLPPSPSEFCAAPWIERGLLLIPAILTADVYFTQQRIRNWRRNQELCPSKRKIWSQHVLLPLIPNLFITLFGIPLFGKLRDFLRLYSPDYAWISQICSSFAAVWIFVRTRLLIRTYRRVSESISSAKF